MAKLSAQSQRVQQKRIMKELKDIAKCDSVAKGIFTVELADENLFEVSVCWCGGGKYVQFRYRCLATVISRTRKMLYHSDK